jgi:hypothetical protein
MKRWLIGSLAIFLFTLVWGTILYELINKKTEDATNDKIEIVVNEFLSDNQEKIKEVVIMGNEEKHIEITKQHTQLNKLMAPPINEGIDFGEGISIDDLLRNFGIVVNNY